MTTTTLEPKTDVLSLRLADACDLKSHGEVCFLACDLVDHAEHLIMLHALEKVQLTQQADNEAEDDLTEDLW